MAATRRLLLTGGNSGIGFEAAVRLCQAGHSLTLLCRDAATAETAQRQLAERAGGGTAPAVAVCDLGDLESVRACGQALLAQGQPIDTLVLNAGLQYAGATTPRLTPQGHELTIAVNHLGHFLLAQQLTPLLLAGQAPRLVVTASEVHDPLTAGGKVGSPAGLGDLAGLQAGQPVLMVDGSSFDADKAYKDSKLCNVLFAREFARRMEEAGTPLPVLSWSPGLVIPPTSEGGFWRYSRQSNELGQRLFAFAARSVLRLTESVETAGDLLAALCCDPAYAANGFSFHRNRVVGPGRRVFEASTTSVEGQDTELARRLWVASEGVVG
jgi:protochlorophyllide reductase